MSQEYTLAQVVEELQELSAYFNKRVSEIKEQYLIDSVALHVLKKSDDTIGFSLDIDKIK